MGKTPEENTRFLLIITAIIAAIDEYADLLRATVATATNDRRLCGFEAPPTIISAFIGDDLQKIFNTLIKEKKKKNKTIKLGETLLSPINKFSTDRNRTSPFAFVDNRFEFRMPGSSTSVAVCNTILNVAVADQISQIADVLEKSQNLYEDAQKLIINLIEKHSRIIYNGNGYSEEWVKEAENRGLKNIKAAPEALKAFTYEKNIKLFEKYGIYTRKEAISRYQIKVDKYSSWIDIEAKTMLAIAKTEILPVCLKFSEKITEDIIRLKEINIDCNLEIRLLEKIRTNMNNFYNNLEHLENELENANKIEDFEEKAKYYQEKIISSMDNLRENVDNLEVIIPKKMWPMPTYSDIFLED